jgi:diadenosine tetraphosphate (Ap4A) HIT family hydrolase
MSIIFETQDFIVNAHDKPHHSRENGGHIIIWPKQHFAQQADMPVELAQNFMVLSMIVGEAFTKVMQSQGLKVARVNYQNNGNWAYKKTPPEPQTHLHLYLRTWGEKHPTNDPLFQPFPDALVFPPTTTDFYDKFVALTEQDCIAIKNEILSLFDTEKYQSVMVNV